MFGTIPKNKSDAYSAHGKSGNPATPQLSDKRQTRDYRSVTFSKKPDKTEISRILTPACNRQPAQNNTTNSGSLKDRVYAAAKMIRKHVFPPEKTEALRIIEKIEASPLPELHKKLLLEYCNDQQRKQFDQYHPNVLIYCTPCSGRKHAQTQDSLMIKRSQMDRELTTLFIKAGILDNTNHSLQYRDDFIKVEILPNEEDIVYQAQAPSE